MLVLARNPRKSSAMTDERAYFTIKIPPQASEVTIKIAVIESDSHKAKIGIEAPRFCQVVRADALVRGPGQSTEEAR